MVYPVKSSAGITLVPLETRLLSSRRLLISGDDGINSDKACEIASLIMLLNEENSEKPIDLLICSGGGEINSGLLIYDAIQGSVAPIRTICLGKAYSMAAVLFACGNHGRLMLPHSELMLHEPLLGNRISGNASSIQSISESLLDTKKKINAILAKHTGRTEQEIDEVSRFDHYFSPEESVAFGLADRIVGFDSMMEVGL